MSDRLTISYTAKDYAGFRRLMLDKKRETMPEWTSESPNDFGVVLIELFAYVGDILSFYQDRIASEAFLSTATNRTSIVDIARTLGYQPTGTTAATVEVEFTTNDAVTIPAGTEISTETRIALEASEDPVFFETIEELVFTEAGTQAVQCVEGRTVDEDVGTSTGLIDQSFMLDRFPVIENSTRIFIDEGIGTVEWTYVERLIEATSAQNAFTTLEESDGSIAVYFGDNVNGRVPAGGAEITARYRVGVGERGNTGPNTLTELHALGSAAQQAVTLVTNPNGAAGGADQESLRSIRRNAPQAFLSQDRAVSIADFTALVSARPYVAKARAEQVAYNTVAVFAAPTGGGVLATVRKEELAAYLADRKMSNITVLIEDPDYVETNITVEVRVRDSYVRQQVSDQVEAAIASLLEFENMDFAQFIPVSDVYNAVAAIEGVQFSNVTVLDRDAGTAKDNLQFDVNEIPVLGVLTVDATGGIIGT